MFVKSSFLQFRIFRRISKTSFGTILQRSPTSFISLFHCFSFFLVLFSFFPLYTHDVFHDRRTFYSSSPKKYYLLARPASAPNRNHIGEFRQEAGISRCAVYNADTINQAQRVREWTCVCMRVREGGMTEFRFWLLWSHGRLVLFAISSSHL